MIEWFNDTVTLKDFKFEDIVMYYDTYMTNVNQLYMKNVLISIY